LADRRDAIRQSFGLAALAAIRHRGGIVELGCDAIFSAFLIPAFVVLVASAPHSVTSAVAVVTGATSLAIGFCCRPIRSAAVEVGAVQAVTARRLPASRAGTSAGHREQRQQRYAGKQRPDLE
jgi:hypothetical protein